MANNSYNDYFEKAQKQKGIRTSTQSMVRKNKNVKKVETQSQKKSKINLPIVVILLFGFLFTLVGGLYIDDVLKIAHSLEFNFFGQALAEEGAKADPEVSKDKTATSQDVSADKAVSAKPSEDKRDGPSGVSDDQELNHLSRLKERKIELDKREEEIAKIEEDLAKQRQELEEKLKELEEVRRNISSTLETKVQSDDQKVQDLVQFYSNMKPPQAAKILETIDESLAVRVIEKMKKKNAAEIMNLLKPEKAQAISEKYAGYRK